MPRFFVSHALIIGLCLVFMAGCTSAPPRDPLAVVQDRGLETGRRLAALQQLAPIAAQPNRADIVGSLHDIVWSDRHPLPLRQEAMRLLIDDDEPGFVAVADYRMMQVSAWPFMQHLFDVAMHNSEPPRSDKPHAHAGPWATFLGTAIRSYARPSQQYEDNQRPERDVIRHFAGNDDVEAALWQFMVVHDPRYDLRHHIAAWTVLCRLLDMDALHQRVRTYHADETDNATDLLHDLQAAATVLTHLPTNREGYLWLHHLRHGPGQDIWRQAGRIVPQLSAQQRAGLSLRHLPVLVRLDQQALGRTRAQLLEQLQARLSGARHVQRTESRLLREPVDESLATHHQSLCWMDLHVMHHVLDAMADADTVRQWFAQADDDLADTTTEHGGVLDFDADGYRAIAFYPHMTGNDRMFYSSPALIERMYTSLAHYHFHASAHNSTAYAGPGAGDFDFADALDANGIVLTFIDANTLNVDYYQRGKVAIDLGCITRW